MSSRNNDKNKEVIKELEKMISPVLVVNNSSLKPYVELFEYAPENIYQQPLGSLVGFFEIKEYSQDSAYIVNFLTSVLKKEYYINPKRPVTESLDSALHKVNLALSELAKQGNIEWLGKLNAAICILEKNNAHFSVSGNAKIFLYRNTILSDISEGLASDSIEPHPLKTFVNVSSGRLEKDDRLLITSEDIFHIFSTNELKKNFQRFEGGKFVQFLKTALSNQLEMISSVIVEIKEAELVEEKTVSFSGKKVGKVANVFSEKTFAKASSKNTEESSKPEDQNDDREYTDKKTGHIYVQEEEGELEKAGKSSIYMDLAKERISHGWYLMKNNIRRRFALYKKQQAKKKALRQAEKEEKSKLLAEEKKREQERKAAEDLARIEMEKQQALEAQKLAAELEKQKEIEAKQQAELQLQKSDIEENNVENIKEELPEIPDLPAEEKIIEITPAEEPTQEKELTFKEKLAIAMAEERKKVLDRLKKEDGENDLEKELETIQESQPEEVAENETEQIETISHKTINQEQERKLGFKEKLAIAMAEERKKSITRLKKEVQEIDSKEDTVAEQNDDEIQEKSAIFVSLKSSLTAISQKSAEKLKVISASIGSSTQRILEKIKFNRSETSIENVPEKIESEIVPHFSKIKKLFSSFSNKQKIYTLLAFVVIFIVPFFIVHWMNNRSKTQTAAPTVEIKTSTLAETLANDKNINLNSEVKNILSNNNIVAPIVTNNGIVTVTKNSVIAISGEEKNEFTLPEKSGTAISAAFMKDLSLVFILTNQNKLFSFSPVTSKFTDNTISLPANSSSLSIGTYLTYLYVLDPEANQIYRYPRATGGFGDKTSWLKDSAVSLSGASDMTLDDNIYYVQNNKVVKLFKGSKQDFTLENSNTPISFSKIFTNIDSPSIYVLDDQNARVIQYNKADGTIAAQYFNESLKNSAAFSIDETSKKAYISTSDSLLTIGL